MEIISCWSHFQRVALHHHKNSRRANHLVRLTKESFPKVRGEAGERGQDDQAGVAETVSVNSAASVIFCSSAEEKQDSAARFAPCVLALPFVPPPIPFFPSLHLFFPSFPSYKNAPERHMTLAMPKAIFPLDLGCLADAFTDTLMRRRIRSYREYRKRKSGIAKGRVTDVYFFLSPSFAHTHIWRDNAHENASPTGKRESKN